MTSARFWAPQRATLTPDAVVLALLEPDAGDLATKVLALHRAGAAACDVVAAAPVPSEAGLAQALADVRALVAPTAVDAIAKSLDPVYAGLLVRDLLDDAEDGALALFRAAVSKGVPPPTAVTRAGMVYGVATKSMGRYFPLATDPKTTPVALVDAADRTLLGYVSTVVETEQIGVKEEVSKAPRDETSATAEWDPEEHPRSTASGEFVVDNRPSIEQLREKIAPKKQMPVQLREKGVLDESPLARLRSRLRLSGGPTVQGAEQQEEVVAERAAPERRTRAARKPARKTRRTRAVAPPAPSAAAPAAQATGRLRPTGGKLTSSGRLQSAGGALRRKTGEALRSRSNRLKAGNKELRLRDADIPSYPPRPPGGSGPGNLLRRVNNDDWGGGLSDQSVSVVTDYHTAMALINKMAGQNTPDRQLFFRVGHLHEAAGADFEAETAIESEDQIRWRNETLENQIDFLAEQAKASEPGYVPAKVYPLSNPNKTPEEQARDLRGLVGADEPDGVWVGDHTQMMLDYVHLGDVLVHYQPSPDDSEDRPAPVVVKFTTMGMARMHDDTPGSAQSSIQLDPNQVYMLDRDFTNFWDDDRSVMIREYEIRPLEDNEVELYLPGTKFEKVLEGAEAAEFELKHPRETVANERGRFAYKDDASRVTRSALARARPLPTKVAEAPAGPSALEQLRARFFPAEPTPVAVENAAPPTKARERKTRQTRRTRTTRRVREATAPAAEVQAEQAPQEEARNVGSGSLARSNPLLRSTTMRSGRLKTTALVTTRNRLRQGDSRLVRALAESRPPEPSPEDGPERNVDDYLDQTSYYQVMTPHQFRALLKRAQVETNGIVKIHGSALDWLKASQFHDAGSAIAQLSTNLTNMIDAKEGPAFSSSGAFGIIRNPLGQVAFDDTEVGGGDDEVWNKVAPLIRHIFQTRPMVSQLLINHLDGVVQVYGNRLPVERQVFIEFEEGMDLTAPMQLIPVGHSRTSKLIELREDVPGRALEVGYDDVRPFDAPIMRYYAEPLD